MSTSPQIPVATTTLPLKASSSVRTWMLVGIAFLAGAMLACPCGIGAGWWVGKGSIVAKGDGEGAKEDEQNKGAATKIKLTALTDAERARWKRIRAKYKEEGDDDLKSSKSSLIMTQQSPDSPDKNQIIAQTKKHIEEFPLCRYQCLAYSLKEKHWNSVSVTYDETTTPHLFERSIPKWRYFTSKVTYLRQHEDDARKLAMSIASLPDIRCVAIVDLFSATDPEVFTWIHDDGTGARASATLPFPELLNEFKSYVHELQTIAD